MFSCWKTLASPWKLSQFKTNTTISAKRELRNLPLQTNLFRIIRGWQIGISASLISRSHSIPLSQLIIALSWLKSSSKLPFILLLLLKLLLLLHMLLSPLLLLPQLSLSHVPRRSSIVAHLLLLRLL